MTPPTDSDHGLRGAVRRATEGARDAADSAFDATVGRVGHSVGEAALEATNATAQQVIEDLEPYLIAEAVPRIVAGITPYLTEEVVPGVLTGITDYLTAVTIPEMVDGVSGHLVEVTVPEVVAGVTPRLVDDLLPRLLTDLRPYLEEQLVPQIVDGLAPYLEQTIAPQLVDALMPKIREEVVPQILDDIVDDPRIRDLIREQSQGLFLDAIEGFRGTLADLDSLVDNVGRRLLRRPPRPKTETALQLVLADTSPDDTEPMRLAIEDLSKQRAAWRALPAPPAPPGRSFTYAGAVTRLLGLVIDIFVVGYLSTVLFSNIASLIDSLFGGTPPEWLALTLVAMAAAVIPMYLGLCYWALGRTLGMGIVGIRVCTPDGRRPGFLRALARAWVGMIGLFFWLATSIVALVDAKRRSLLDRVVHTEVRYSVPETQQSRHVRDAVQEQRAVVGRI